MEGIEENEIEIEIDLELEESESEFPRMRSPTEGNPTIAEFYRRLGVM